MSDYDEKLAKILLLVPDATYQLDVKNLRAEDRIEELDDIKWVAMDEDGDWFGYSKEPTAAHDDSEWLPNDDQVTNFLGHGDGINWRESLMRL